MSILAVAGALGSLAGGATNGFKDWNPSNWANNLGSNIKNTWDYIKNGNTNSINKEIAMKNLEMQQNENEYQHALQQQIFDREDTAYQRTVEDMRSAGLNPLTMNGTDSAGEAIATQAPQINYEHQDKSPLEMMSEAFAIANSIQDFSIGFAYNEEQIAKAQQAKAQANILDNQALLSNSQTNYEITKKQLETEDLIREYKSNEATGTWKGMPERERMARYQMLVDAEDTDARLKTELNKSLQDYYNQDNKTKQFIGKEGAEKVQNIVNEAVDTATNLYEKGKEKVNKGKEAYRKWRSR